MTKTKCDKAGRDFGLPTALPPLGLSCPVHPHLPNVQSHICCYREGIQAPWLGVPACRPPTPARLWPCPLLLPDRWCCPNTNPVGAPSMCPKQFPPPVSFLHGSLCLEPPPPTLTPASPYLANSSSFKPQQQSHLSPEASLDPLGLDWGTRPPWTPISWFPTHFIIR